MVMFYSKVSKSPTLLGHRFFRQEKPDHWLRVQPELGLFDEKRETGKMTNVHGENTLVMI
jgi:hypothetical protein